MIETIPLIAIALGILVDQIEGKEWGEHLKLALSLLLVMVVVSGFAAFSEGFTTGTMPEIMEVLKSTVFNALNVGFWYLVGSGISKVEKERWEL